MKDVALITIHGMGKVEPTYYLGLQEKLKNKLGAGWERVAFQPIQYADVLQGPEDALWDAMLAIPDNTLRAKKLRQFVLYGFSDAGSFEHSAQTDKTQYIAIQKLIQEALARALAELNGDVSKPVVLIAHSLGCHVISSYLWDAQHDRNIFAQASSGTSDTADFLKLSTLTNLVTTGCDMPIIIGGMAERCCFDRPNPVFVWDNFYDPDDVLGWPVRQLGKSYEIANDHVVNVGGMLTSWNMSSHLEYWTDADIIAPLTEMLKAKIT